jgi:hypothetical protein
MGKNLNAKKLAVYRMAAIIAEIGFSRNHVVEKMPPNGD